MHLLLPEKKNSMIHLLLMALFLMYLFIHRISSYRSTTRLSLHRCGKIILDKNGMGERLKKNVLDYIERIPLKTEEDISQEIKWCEKMLLRTMRGDVEGYYRWHWVLCDSLEIYFDIKGIHYYGPKKALRFMEESDSEAFHIYSKALLEFNQEGLSDWINYLKTIF